MAAPLNSEFEARLRTLAPQVLGALVRRYGAFDVAEDAVQEALLAAATQWPVDGVPELPRGWLITVASRRLIEQFRRDEARRTREVRAWSLDAADGQAAESVPDRDDTLQLLLLCCHESLPPRAQVALTLRAVGGLTTAEIARAYFEPESTVAQRISRAKRRIQDSGATFGEAPDLADPAADDRLRVVLQVLYLIFTEGSTVSAGDLVDRVDLTSEAIRLTRALVAGTPGHGEAIGLLALMLLTDARRPARSWAGEMVPLDEQDRGRWNREAIAEGTALVQSALTTAPIGPYQLQAAINAVHDQARSVEETDWPEILGLYDLLDTIAPGPVVTLNRTVALGMALGAAAGLDELDRAAASSPTLAEFYRTAAARGYLLDLAGRRAEARAAYAVAAEHSPNLAEQRYLRSKSSAPSSAPDPLDQAPPERDGGDFDPVGTVK